MARVGGTMCQRKWEYIIEWEGGTELDCGIHVAVGVGVGTESCGLEW